ncbi:MAG: hypothetical protein RMJ43_09510 [Chloroherpetonaceae bacterium]|nr:hypothetical protein [Chthonomonadaceae bacterium]MDW8208061.1 hypothetical protein [Chloroherpetonaceae bacterium]
MPVRHCCQLLFRVVCLLAAVCSGDAVAHAWQKPATRYPGRDTFSDTWTATDALGRTLPGYEQVGPPRKNRTVGIFYFLWHGEHVQGGPYDITKILQQDPEAMRKPDSPLWGPLHAPHHWGEPLFGYYLSDDAYVLRRHAQMLSDAGVDVVIFDVTNQFTYRRYYMALLKVFSEVRAAGGRTPQVAFLCPFWSPARVVAELYRDLYAPGLYPDLWFRWQGKPLILADPLLLEEGEGFSQHNTPAELLPGRTLGQSFTTHRRFDAVACLAPTWRTQHSAVTLTLLQEGPRGRRIARKRFRHVADNAWLSLSFPKPLPPGTYYLEMSHPQGKVGWWSHTEDLFPNGQAYVDGARVSGDRCLRIATLGEGTRLRDFFTFRKPQPDYFQGPTAPNMWSWLEVYPQHVFRNDRGEKEQMSVGVAQNAVQGRLGAMSEPGARGRNWHNGANDTSPGAVLRGLNFAEQFEHALKEDPQFLFITGWNEWIAGRFAEFAGVRLPVMFVDQFNQEFSRDIEPMKGGHADNYYYQMVSYIRRFKGVRRPPTSSPPKTIVIDGDFSDWKDVRPEYRDDADDPAHRDHPGWNHVEHYRNTTGRNDFVQMKVARDRVHLYFYVRTKEPITPPEGSRWMLLFLNTDGDPTTGWEGYNFVVNRLRRGDGTSILEESQHGWHWRPKGEVRYRIRGSEMELAIRRADLGLADLSRPIQLEFKWSDNMQREGDILDFLIHGDAAPGGRFNYLYRAPAR